jgi:KaiC/GvpD/RAD55 family RecA-like ATPase
MDTLPPQHTDGAIELLRRGVEVYYLRRLTLIEKMRREHKLPKSARGDIRH